jgi:hypothetical protein
MAVKDYSCRPPKKAWTGLESKSGSLRESPTSLCTSLINARTAYLLSVLFIRVDFVIGTRHTHVCAICYRYRRRSELNRARREHSEM